MTDGHDWIPDTGSLFWGQNDGTRSQMGQLITVIIKLTVTA